MGANLILPSSSPADDAEVVTKSCRFDGTAAYMSRTFGTPTDLDKWTWACWVKRAEMDTLQVLFGSLNISGSPVGGGIYFSADNTLTFYDAGSGANLKTTAVFRDYSSWYHLAVTSDSAGGDAAIYVNGELITDFSTETEPSGTNSAINTSTAVHHIAREVSVTGYFAGVYLADMYFVDGAIVAPKGNFTNDPATDTNGQLKPKAYTVSGTNGFHLDFKDGDALGADAAGSNDFAESGLAASDQMNDRPTNNYAVWNPLSLGSGGTLTEGNLELATSSSGYANCYSTIAMGESNDTQKYYAEFYVTDAALAIIGMATLAAYDTSHVGNNNESWGYYQDGSLRWGSWATPGSNDSYSNGEIIGVMYDASADTITFYNEGVAQTYGFSSTQNLDTKKPLVFAMSDGSGSGTAGAVANYGQDPTFAGNKTSGQDTSQSEFYYAPPTGAVALSTANLPDPTIAKGHKYFNTLLYDDGTGAKTFGAADNLSPDLVWVKSRGSGFATNNHKLTDSLRGVQKSLESDTVDAEVTESSNVGVTVFGADGFTIGSSSSTTGPYADQTGTGMVGWGWKQDSTPGFKIVEWTGDTNTSQEIDTSGLGAAPDFGIFKSLASANWYVYHKSLTTMNYIVLNEPDTQTTYGDYLWTVGEWDSDSIKVGNDTYFLDLNTNTQDYVAYLFSEVSGFSKFGIYTANQAVDGPFVWLGFRPAFLMIKERSSSYENWVMLDSKRSTFNLADDYIYADTGGSEGDGYNGVDFLSNGFKVRTGGDSINYGTDYIFAAFAESPFKYSSAR